MTDPADTALEQILSSPEATWEAEVARLCAERPELAAEVQRRFAVLRESGLAAAAAGPHLATTMPARLGEFVPVRVLGEGGMGIVYEAWQARLDRHVALKIVRPDQLLFAGARERFRREIEAVARLAHEGIVAVHAVGEEQGIPYFAMELLRGASLDAIVREWAGRPRGAPTGDDLARAVAAAAGADAGTATAPLFAGSWADVCMRIGSRLASALAHAHAHGVVHRDVKPSNVVVTAAGRVVLLDFGLATATDSSRVTRTGAELGSLPYQAPETLRGRLADEAGDQYALAVTLHELLARRHPFLGATPAITRANVLAGVPRPLPRRAAGVPRELAIVIGKAMEPEPAARYPTIAAFAADLDAVRNGQPIAARRSPATRRLWRWCVRHPTASTAAALGALLALGTPTAVALGIARERDRAVAAEQLAQCRAYEANIAAANAALQTHDAAEARRRLDACDADRRGFEWRLLAAALDGSLAEQRVCPGAVKAVALSDDASLVAAADADGAVVLWSPADAAAPRRLARWKGAVEHLAFVAGASRLLILGADGRAGVLDVDSGTLTAERARETSFEHLHLDAEGKLLVAANGEWRATLLDPATLAVTRVVALQQLGTPPRDNVAAASGLIFVRDVADVQVFDLATGAGRQRIRLPHGATMIAAGGGSIAVLGRDGRPYAGPPDRLQLASLDSADAGVEAIAVDVRGDYAFGRATDRTVRVWRLRDGARVATLVGAPASGPLAVARDRLLLATGTPDGCVRLWSPFGSHDRQLLFGSNDFVSSLALTRGGRLLSASRSAAVFAWDPATGEPLRRFGSFPHWVNAVASTPDSGRFQVCFHGTVECFDLDAPQPRWQSTTGASWVHALATAPAGDRLLAATEDRGAMLLSAADGAASASLGGHQGAVLCCGFAPDGTRAFTGGRDGRLLRHELAATVPPLELDRSTGPVRALVCSRDGRRVYSAAGPMLRAHDAATGHLAWEHPCTSDALCVAELGDGSRLLSGHADGGVVIRDPGNGQPLLVIVPWPAAVRSLAIDPAGDWLAAAGENGLITLLRTTRPPDAAAAIHRADIRRALLLAPELQPATGTRDAFAAAVAARTDLTEDQRTRMVAYAAILQWPSWTELAGALEVACSPGRQPGEYEAALRTATAALAWPDEVLGPATAALARERLGDHDTALQISEEGLRRHGASARSMNPVLHAARALAMQALGRHAEAERERDALVQGLSGQPADPLHLSLRLQVESALGR